MSDFGGFILQHLRSFNLGTFYPLAIAPLSALRLPMHGFLAESRQNLAKSVTIVNLNITPAELYMSEKLMRDRR